MTKIQRAILLLIVAKSALWHNKQENLRQNSYNYDRRTKTFAVFVRLRILGGIGESFVFGWANATALCRRLHFIVCQTSDLCYASVRMLQDKILTVAKLCYHVDTKLLPA